LAVVGLTASLGVGVAWAQSQEGVFSAEGLQLLSDARVYAAFAVLNNRGYDREVERGPDPTQAARYNPVRQRLRERLKLGADTEKAADAFIRGHPDSAVRYVRAALSLEDAPAFAVPEGAALGGYEGLGKVMMASWNAGVGEMYDNDTAELRRVVKEALPTVDKLTKEAREVLRMGGSADDQFSVDGDSNERLVVVYNPLDSHGTQVRHRAGNARYVVLGPWKQVTDPGVLDPILVEFVHTLVAPETRKVGSSPQAVALFSKAGPDAARYEDTVDFLSDGFARAVAQRVLKRPVVLKVGLELEPAGPLAADFTRVVGELAKGSVPFGQAVGGMLESMVNPAPVPEGGAAAPAPGALTPPAAPAVPPVPAPAPKTKPAGKSP
jgi:hypothetical protein